MAGDGRGRTGRDRAAPGLAPTVQRRIHAPRGRAPREQRPEPCARTGLSGRHVGSGARDVHVWPAKRRIPVYRGH